MTSLAARQYGTFSLEQAAACGYSRSAVFRRVRSGRLRPVFLRVYRFAGAPPTFEQRVMAAILWAARGAVASHATAAALWRIAEPDATVHVTTDRKLGRPPRGVRSHVAGLANRERGTLRGIPITSIGRTLLDLAGERPPGAVLAAVERAVLDGLVTSDQLRDVVARNRGRRGCRRLAGVLADAGSSALERRVERLLLEAGVPPFVREHVVGPYRLDFAWPDQRVAVETDGRRWHSSGEDFIRERAKHNALVNGGWRFLRVTWADLDDPERIVGEIGALLTVS